MIGGLVLAALPGLALAAWGSRPAGRWGWAFALALATPLGLAVTSALFFLYAAIFSPGTRFGYYVAVEVMVGLASLLILRKVAAERDELDRASPSAPSTGFRLLGLLVLVALALSLGRFATEVVTNPDGRWDAWITWNVRARFMYLGGQQWTAGFSPALQVGHTEYPLLLPGAVARLWFYAGDATRLAPVAIAFVFTYSLIAAAGSALRLMHNSVPALLAVFTLACAPGLLEAGALQYADAPLALYILTSVILYCMHTSRTVQSRGGLAVILGASIGAVAWTKPEGISFLACFLVAWIVFEGILRKQPRAAFVKSCLRLAAGLLPFALCLAIFQTRLAGPSWILAGRQFPEVFQKLTDTDRYLSTAGSMLSQLWTLAGWKFGVIPLLLLGAALGVRSLSAEERRAAFSGAAVLTLAALSYFMVYVISPKNPATLAPVSLGRLVLHLYPAFFFLAFYVIKSPLAAPKSLVAARKSAA